MSKPLKQAYWFSFRPLVGPQSEEPDSIVEGPFTPEEAAAHAQQSCAARAMTTGRSWVVDYGTMEDKRATPLVIVIAVIVTVLALIFCWSLIR